MHKHFKAFTLMELLVAIALLTIIVIGISQVEIFSNLHTITSDHRAKLQNAASFALEHMTKNIGMAIGDFNNAAIVRYADGQGFRIKIDTNQNGLRDDDNTDKWIAYRHENLVTSIGNDSELKFYPDAGTGALPAGNYETIATQLVIDTPGGVLGLNLDPTDFDASDHLITNRIQVGIICRWFPDKPAATDNPQIAMIANIQMPSVTYH